MSEVTADYYDEEYFMRGTKSNYGGRFAPYVEEVYYPIAKIMRIKLVTVFEPKKVMVLGCARGYLIRALREVGVEAYGVDISKWAVENADEKAKNYIYLGDIADLSRWKNGEFDLVVAADVLEHIPKEKLPKVLDEIARICSRHVYALIPVVDVLRRDKSHVSIFPSRWWIKQFEHRGFTLFSLSFTKQNDGITNAEMAFVKA
jgi:2-polyprenyl-3-methyl-5-hydroxy-6-metoxy-1,4-benzoquinol methylase